MERVVEGTHRRLVTVLAGAGYGKSTLVAQVLGRVEPTSVWISCDERLGGSADLVAHIAAGIERSVPGFGAQLALEGTVERQVIALCNEIVATTADDLVLVLDDVHLLDAGGTKALEGLVRDLPPSVHIVVAGRAPLGIALGKLRAGQLLEIREDDLSLSESETASIWRAGGRDAAAEVVRQVYERTEGWVAGVLLAAQAGHVEPERRPSDGQLFDYLAEEVMLAQAPATQDFLLQTAVFERFSPALAAALTGRDESSEMCRELVARHLFTMRLEAEGEWYRYHHLFQAFLRARVNDLQPDLAPELHRRAASAWIEAGEPGQAVEHLLAAGDDARAAEVIDSLADEMMYTPQSALLARWIERLPEQEHHGRPALVLARAGLTFAQGDYAGAFTLLEPAIEDFIAQDNHERAAAAFFLLIYAQLAGGTPQTNAIDVGYRQLSRIEEGARLLPASMVLMASELGCATRYAEADELLGRVLRLRTTGIDPLGPGYLASTRAFYIDHPRGRSRSALATIEWVIGLFEANERFDTLNYLLALLVYRAILLNHLGRFDEALAETGRIVETALRRGARGGVDRSLTKVRAVALAGLERWDEVEVELARAEPLDRMRGSSYAFRMRAPAARLAAHRGDVELVAHHAAVVMDDVEAFGFSFDTPGWICDIAGAALQVGLLEDARRLQRHVMTGADRAQNPWARARGLLLWALVTEDGDADAALAEGLALTDEYRLEEIWTRRDRPLAGRALARAIAGGLGPDGVAARLAVRCGAEVLEEAVERLSSAPAGARAAFAAQLVRAGGIDAETRAKLVGEPAGAAGSAAGEPSGLRRPPLRLVGLGGFVVRRGGEAVPVSAFGRERARALLAALMCNPGPVHREQLLDWLWPDLDVERGLRAFHVTLHALRRAIEPEIDRRSSDRSIVRAEGEGYRLVLWDDDATDLDDFLGRAAAAAAGTGSPRRLDALLEAEGAYAGPLFPEWPYADWAVERRREVDRAYTTLLERLAETLSADGRHREAQLRWERLVALEPEREGFHRNLILGYAEAGEKALALRQYHACRAVLRRELGVEASPETRGLYQLILEDKPLPRREVATAA